MNLFPNLEIRKALSKCKLLENTQLGTSQRFVNFIKFHFKKGARARKCCNKTWVQGFLEKFLKHIWNSEKGQRTFFSSWVVWFYLLLIIPVENQIRKIKFTLFGPFAIGKKLRRRSICFFIFQIYFFFNKRGDS